MARDFDRGVGYRVAAQGNVSVDENLDRALEELEKLYPSLGWTPNIAQERPLADLRDGPYPFIQVMTFGNGTGKTDVLAYDIAGTMLGADFLNDWWYVGVDGRVVGGQDLTFYRRFDRLRDSGKLKCRVVCDGEDMKENGSLYEAIKNMVPTAKFAGGRAGTPFKQIRIPHPSIAGVENIIDVKTFDQDTTSHAGANMHRIWINEPPSYPIFSENVRRTRAKKGELPGSMMIAATVLSKAVWLFNLAEDRSVSKMGRVVMYQGCSWENCAGEDITDEIALEYFDKMGVELPKRDGKYWTRGVLSRESIENMIATLEKEYPDEVDAFVWGGNVALQGAIYKAYKPAIHRVPRLVSVPPTVPVFHVVDPHPVRPDAALWAYLDAMERVKIFWEHPREPYTKLRSRSTTIAETVEAWRIIERQLGIGDQVVMRIGDPNRMNTSDSRDNRPLYTLYAEEGMSFVCDRTYVNNNIDYGHRTVQKWLWYPKERYRLDPMDPRNQPGLQVTENCTNVHEALLFYATKMLKDPTKPVSDNLDETYKDFADLIRYLMVVIESGSYREFMAHVDGSAGGDYDKILAGRDPYASPGAGSDPDVGVHGKRGRPTGKMSEYERILAARRG